MAGKKTSLITGSNAKIRVNGVTMAYATDISYTMDVATVPVETMGRYEVLANEPIATMVGGNFTVVRYTKAAKVGGISGAAANGNGVGNWKGSGSPEPDGMHTHFDPAKILTAHTVDIEVFQKKQNDPTGDGEAQGVYLVKKIRDARLTRMAGSVNKRGILQESFSFVAELADDDSFTSGPSGEEDLGS
jgi:hypothetical protein